MSSGGHRRSVDALFAALGESGDAGARTELIERHLPLARTLAARYRYTPAPLEDLEQVASLALVKAVDGFDPGHGVPFAGYAIPSILGALKRHMRDSSWSLRVPRALQERVLVVERAERALAVRLGRAPNVEALAAEAGLSAEQVLEALNARVAHDAVSLESAQGPGSPEASPLPAVGDFSATADDRLSLSDALRGLHPRDQRILRLRFVEDMTQSEIAAEVGLSQMYVSRVLRATLERLRAQLG